MRNKYLSLLAILLAVASFGLLYAVNLHDSKNQSSTYTQEEIRGKISDYLAAHLSELSPTKEVLGGKFYITNISFPAENQAIVQYEDGHIALTGNVQYLYNDGQIKITSFTNQ